MLRSDVAEIEEERRNHYRCYVDNPGELLAKDLPAWREKWLTARGR